LYAGESEGVNLSILSESEVSLSFFGKGGQEYSYNLGLNEQTWIYVPSFEESISSFRITITEINSEDGHTSFAQKEKAYYDDGSLAKVIDSLNVLSINFDEKAGAT